MHQSPGVHRILEGENHSMPIIQGVPINMGVDASKSRCSQNTSGRKS